MYKLELKVYNMLFQGTPTASDTNSRVQHEYFNTG